MNDELRLTQPACGNRTIAVSKPTYAPAGDPLLVQLVVVERAVVREHHDAGQAVMRGRPHGRDAHGLQVGDLVDAPLPVTALI